MAKKTAAAKGAAPAKTEAQTKVSSQTKVSGMKNFEERLERLEMLGEHIRKTDIPLEEALKAFEEGIRLARTLEQDLEKIENRIEILMNSSNALPEEPPELELFNA